ncbi:MAG TPA: nucleotide sugar dehydrogenase [Ilumatobacter sp.]|nr:nucleotide sugar dehydrogenase [Ilumatobacter sp.]
MINAPAPTAPDRRVVVIGLGYVGLPLAVEAARAGLSCVGLDVNQQTVDGLNAGRSHVDDISDEQLAALPAGSFTATTDAACLAEAEVAVICVPTPLDEHQAPDLRAVEGATRAIRDHLHTGMLVVLESTTYPGTTDGPVKMILEESGLVAGVDFALAFSPERIDPGNPTYTLRNTPKIVGGLTPGCTTRAAQFYQRVVDTVVPTKGPREAELAKLLENTYRHVNIALVNEMAVFSHELGIDLWAAIDAARSKPFGFAAFYPGPGVGGHCIPIDPNYLSHQVRTLGYQFRFVELAQEISQRMPAYVVRRSQDLLNRHRKAVNGSTVLVLGLTYKPDIADDRETPARAVITELRKLGANVIGHDPHLSAFVVDDVAVEMSSDLDTDLTRADLTVLLQHHQGYDLTEIARLSSLVFDTRGRAEADNVERL